MQTHSETVDAVGKIVSQHPDERVLFVASFDGVLAEYEHDPDDARVAPARVARLRRLQQAPATDVAIITGRSLIDLHGRIDIGEGAYYIGLHGLEVTGPGCSRSCEDVLRPFGERMRDVALRVRTTLRDVPGVRIERKGPVLALHTQDAAPDDAVWSRFQLLGAAAEFVNAGVVRTLRGHDVLELLPNVGCSRADALRTVRTWVETRHGESVFIVYIGEDLADDESVRMIHENGVAAGIGQRTRAPYHVDAHEIDALLEELIAARSRPRCSPDANDG